MKQKLRRQVSNKRLEKQLQIYTAIGEIVDYDYCLKEIEENFDLRDKTGVSVEEIDSEEEDDCECEDLCFVIKQ